MAFCSVFVPYLIILLPLGNGFDHYINYFYLPVPGTALNSARGFRPIRNEKSQLAMAPNQTGNQRASQQYNGHNCRCFVIIYTAHTQQQHCMAGLKKWPFYSKSFSFLCRVDKVSPAAASQERLIITAPRARWLVWIISVKGKLNLYTILMGFALLFFFLESTHTNAPLTMWKAIYVFDSVVPIKTQLKPY